MPAEGVQHIGITPGGGVERRMGDDGGQAGLVAAEGPTGAKLSEQARVAQVVPERLVGDG